MAGYTSFSETELQEALVTLEKRYEGFKERGLSLDMSRGKPSAAQLDVSMPMFDVLNASAILKAEDGSDCRNYGGLDGIPEAKRLFAEIFDVKTTQVMIGGNSSLTMMYDAIARAMTQGVLGSKQPWDREEKVRFLCPAPGYDRHFAICEHFGIEMVYIPMTECGPDMDLVENFVREDASVKGIWCVPKYSNPSGITYSKETVMRLAALETAAPDFRIFWDNAYCVHDLGEHSDTLENILRACEIAGHPDRVFMYTSTSKITFPGSGVAAMAASEDNLAFIRSQIGVSTIGPDKINQLRHVRFLKDLTNIREHMKKHAAILTPRFLCVQNILEEELTGKDVAWWNQPRGGYFISLNTMDGCAREAARLAGEVGVTITRAGASFPYGKDPLDRNLRIAPSYPSAEDLSVAIEVLAVCIQMTAIRKLLAHHR